MAAKDKNFYYESVGRRKTSIARVRLLPHQKGLFLVNDKPLADYFSREELRLKATAPLEKTGTARPGEKAAPFSITVKLAGGGIHSQAEALAHGLARALLAADPNHKSVLRQHKLLTRDPRAKERRKFGLKKARKAPQWSKR